MRLLVCEVSADHFPFPQLPLWSLCIPSVSRYLLLSVSPCSSIRPSLSVTFLPCLSAGSVDYLSTIKRDSQNKSGENVFAPKATVPAYAKMTLKPVPSGMKKDGVPISTIAAPTHIVTPAPAAIKPKDKDRDEPITVASAVAALKLTEKPKIPSSGTTETTFPYDVLKDSPPEGVDLANKESYLSAPIFLSVFEMDSKSFECLPKWKKDLIKKKVGLF